MVYICCVPGCKTGYKSNKSDAKIALFQFPQNNDLKQKWINAIPRKNWTVTHTHRVCGLHFEDNDFVEISSDSKKRRRIKRDSEKLARPRLKENAVPHIFSGLPIYLSKTNPIQRKSKAATSSARLELLNKTIESTNNSIFESETFHDFITFKQKIKNEIFPKGFVVDFQEDCVWFYYIVTSTDQDGSPTIDASVKVSSTLKIDAFIKSLHLPSSLYDSLLACAQLSTLSEISNVLALCKSLCTNSYQPINNYNLLCLVVQLLEKYITLQTESLEQNESALEVSLVKFVIEQLTLLQCPKNGRRYSPSILTLSFLWQLTSTALYKKLHNVFVLPSVSHLRKLSTRLNVESRKMDLDYLRVHCKDLPEKEKIVVLIVDEVYTAQRVEFTNGSFVGLTEEGTQAKTVLAFMVQSIYGKYKDVVCLIPVKKLDTDLLKTWMYKVLSALNDIFLVVALTADNHVCNRQVLFVFIFKQSFNKISNYKYKYL